MIFATCHSIVPSPGNRAFHHPALRNNRTSLLFRRLFNDSELYGRMLREPTFKPCFVPLIDPNRCHPRKAAMVFAQQLFSLFSVRTIGGMDQDSQ